MDAKKAINLARVVLTLGIIAFFLGFGAEISKPASGTPISGGVGTCTYPQYDSVVLGSLCAVSFLGFFILGLVCLFYIYNGVPIKALTWGTNLFFAFTVIGSLLAEPMVVWATITEGFHHSQNVHNLETTCPPAQKHLFRGASISALVAVLCWYGCLITMLRARADYLRSDPHYRPGGNRNEATSPKGPECNKIHPVLSEDA